MSEKKQPESLKKLLTVITTSLGAENISGSKEIDGRTLEIKVSPASIKKLASVLKNQDFEYLSFITAVDYKTRIEMVYRFSSIKSKIDVHAKCDLAPENPCIESLYEIYKTADWNEREVFDMFGVKFDSHPDLRRILTDDEFPGHPLLKKFKVID